MAKVQGIQNSIPGKCTSRENNNLLKESIPQFGGKQHQLLDIDNDNAVRYEKYTFSDFAKSYS